MRKIEFSKQAEKLLDPRGGVAKRFMSAIKSKLVQLQKK